MEPMTALAVGGSIVSVIGTVLGGVGAMQQSQLESFNIETEDIQNKTLAKQQAQARRNEYEFATSQNLAMFNAAGRDLGADRSVEAFLEAQKTTMADDLKVIQNQSQMQTLKSRQLAAASRKQGQNALVSSLFQATGQASQGYYNYKTI